MSEHQVYEFVAVDKALTKQEMAELRAVSTRAEISSTRFWNEYHWGDLKADPKELLARYFDVHVYTANWGEHRVMFRLPAARIDAAALRPYFGTRRDVLKKCGDYLVLELNNPDDNSEPDDSDAETGDVAALVSLRAGLLKGDLRVAYLAWLLAVQGGAIPDRAHEPAVPPGLHPLPAPLVALVEFLRLDEDLLRAATEGSATVKPEPDALRRWIARLTPKEKDRWLTRAIEHPNQPLGAELLASFREAHTPDEVGNRTVGQLRARAEVLAEIGEREAQAETARQVKRMEEQRQKRLTTLARGGDRSWARLEALVEAGIYADAIPLAVDLHDAALRSQQPATFLAKLTALKQRHPSRRGFFTGLQRQLQLRPESERIGSQA